MSARHRLYLYLAILPVPTFVHDPALLALGLLAALTCAGRERWRILKKSLVAMLVFNLSVSLGVVLVGLWRGQIDSDWLLLANLRVLLMTFLGFWFVARTNLLAALTGWPTATWVATLALGQTRAFERLLRDFRLAFASRNLVRPRLIDRRRQVGAQAIALLDKAQAQSTEVALAMRSRGSFEPPPQTPLRGVLPPGGQEPLGAARRGSFEPPPQTPLRGVLPPRGSCDA